MFERKSHSDAWHDDFPSILTCLIFMSISNGLQLSYYDRFDHLIIPNSASCRVWSSTRFSCLVFLGVAPTSRLGTDPHIFNPTAVIWSSFLCWGHFRHMSIFHYNSYNIIQPLVISDILSTMEAVAQTWFDDFTSKRTWIFYGYVL